MAWDGDSQTVVFCDSGIMQQLPASAVAPSAYASDSEDISEVSLIAIPSAQPQVTGPHVVPCLLLLPLCTPCAGSASQKA